MISLDAELVGEQARGEPGDGARGRAVGEPARCETGDAAGGRAVGEPSRGERGDAAWGRRSGEIRESMLKELERLEGAPNPDVRTADVIVHAIWLDFSLKFPILNGSQIATSLPSTLVATSGFYTVAFCLH